LFQHRNVVQVSWGYKEDSSNVRIVAARIMTIQTDFPESGSPVTTIICQSERAALNQITSRKGVPLGRAIKASNDLYQRTEDLKVSELLTEICNKIGAKCIISPKFLNETLDKDKQKIWVSGESFDEFLKKLAVEHSAYYDFRLDPKTSKPTLIFIKKSDFEASPISSDPTLFYYKHPQSIVKSVSIKADIGIIANNGEVGFDEEGNAITNSAEDPQENTELFRGEKYIDSSPLGTNPVPVAQSVAEQLAKAGVTGKAEYNPVEVGEKNYSESVEAKIEAASKKSVLMELIAIGHTRLTPGIINVSGIGARYSGKYRLIAVTHTLDINGYICRCKGQTYTATDGVDIANSSKGEEAKEEQVVIRQFEESSKTVRDNYEKFIYKK
jgi:hypothetical protein